MLILVMKALLNYKIYQVKNSCKGDTHRLHFENIITVKETGTITALINKKLSNKKLKKNNFNL